MTTKYTQNSFRTESIQPMPTYVTWTDKDIKELEEKIEEGASFDREEKARTEKRIFNMFTGRNL